MFFKVTRDFAEYKRLSGSSRLQPGENIMGLSYNGCIWIRNLSPTTIAHEGLHRILNFDTKYGSIRLFFDFLDSIHDVVYHFLKYRGARERIYEGLAEIEECWTDFLDFTLCR